MRSLLRELSDANLTQKGLLWPKLRQIKFARNSNRRPFGWDDPFEVGFVVMSFPKEAFDFIIFNLWLNISSIKDFLPIPCPCPIPYPQSFVTLPAMVKK